MNLRSFLARLATLNRDLGAIPTKVSALLALTLVLRRVLRPAWETTLVGRYHAELRRLLHELAVSVGVDTLPVRRRHGRAGIRQGARLRCLLLLFDEGAAPDTCTPSGGGVLLHHCGEIYSCLPSAELGQIDHRAPAPTVGCLNSSLTCPLNLLRR